MLCAKYKLKSIEKAPPAMKIAIPVRGDWVSTVLDFTEALLMIHCEAGADQKQEQRRETALIASHGALQIGTDGCSGRVK